MRRRVQIAVFRWPRSACPSVDLAAAATIHIATSVALILLTVGCGPHPRPPLAPPGGTRIVIREFAIADTAHVRYGASPEGLGMRLAERIAESLRDRGETASAVAQGEARGEGDLIVSGHITRVDG